MGGGAPQPAAGLGQLVHVVPDALGDGLPLQLAEHRGNVHHRSAHGAGGVEALTDGDKVDLQPPQLLDEGGKVADVAADPVQTVNHHRLELVVPGGFHHAFEVGAVQVAAGKALVLKHYGSVRVGVPESGADVRPAQLHLVADALPLAGKAGFAGIDGNDILVLWHGELLSVLDDSLYCSITESNVSYNKKIAKICKKSWQLNLDLSDRVVLILEKFLIFFNE